MGLPFLRNPLILHSSRHTMCDMTPEQCAYKSRTWLDWYAADYDYGYATVYFVCVLVAVFAVANFAQRFYLLRRSREQRRVAPNKALSWIFAVSRYASYRVFTIQKLGWYSPAIGVILIGCAAWVFFGILTLGPKPYYWPNTEELSFGNSPPIATRTGWMAVALLPFQVACAAKWNFITVLTGVSHEKLQVFHRWSGWLLFILALIHTFPFIVYHIQIGDMMATYREDVYYWTGIATLIPQAWLTFMSIGYIRNLFYETFKALHYLSAAFFIVFFFLHCNFTLTSADYFIALVIIYGLSLLASAIQTYVLSGFSHRATFKSQSDGTFRVSIPTHITWHAGQHVFVRFYTGALGAGKVLTNHPFSICSLPSEDESVPNEIVFYIRPHTGITRSLAKFSKDHPGESIPVLVEGPYGGVDKEALGGFERYLLIAGGSGGGSVLPILERLVRKASRTSVSKDEEGASGQASRFDIRVISVMRYRESIPWFKDAVSKILPSSFPGSLRVSIYITHPTPTTAGTKELETKASTDDVAEITDYSSSSSSDRGEYFSIFNGGGRPNLRAIVKDAAGEDSSSLAITVCGPSSMLYDVRNAAADAQMPILSGKSTSASGVWLHSENFSW